MLIATQRMWEVLFLMPLNHDKFAGYIFKIHAGISAMKPLPFNSAEKLSNHMCHVFQQYVHLHKTISDTFDKKVPDLIMALAILQPISPTPHPGPCPCMTQAGFAPRSQEDGSLDKGVD